MRAALLATVITAHAAIAAAQGAVEIDRTLQKVHGTAIMTSDVRQCRLLKLLTPLPDNDTAILTALENRLLILNEATRATAVEPPADQIAVRRREWSSTWPSAVAVANQMRSAGMNDRALDGWFRDELRIASYLDQRFPADAKRDERIASWIKDLRTRANLPSR